MSFAYGILSETATVIRQIHSQAISRLLRLHSVFMTLKAMEIPISSMNVNWLGLVSFGAKTTYNA